MSDSSSAAAAGGFEASDEHLQRRIGLWGLIALAVSVQVGSGWLLATLAAASMAGPASMIAWVIGAVFFGVIGIAWAELGTMLPRSGAGVRYARLTHGAFLSWFNGWGFLLAAIALPVIEVQAVVTYVGGHWTGLNLLESSQGTTLLAWPNGILTGFVLLIVFFVLNILGVRLLSESNKYITIWKFVIPVATFVLMLFAFKGSNFTAYGGFAPEGVGAIFGAVSGGGIVFAYGGLRQILDFGGEVRDPQRNIPIALIVGGLVIPLALYLVLQLGFVGAIDWAEAGVAPGEWTKLVDSQWGSTPLVDAVAVAGFGWFATVLLTDAALSPAATGWVWLGVAGRTAYSMSVNGELPGRLRRINRHGVPAAGLITCTGLGFLMFLPVPSWYQFVGMVSTALVLGYLLGGPSMAVLRRVAPQLPRPVRIKAPGFWAPAGYVASLLLIYFAGWVTLINLLTAVFLALPIYAAHTSVKNGWTAPAPARTLAAVFTVGWILVGWRGGWLMTVTEKQHAGGWPFPVYVTAMGGCLAVYVGVLWLITSAEGRRQLRSGIWIVPTLFATLVLSYLGAYGPLGSPVLPEGVDAAVVAALGLLTYGWAVRSGYATPELKEIIERETGDAPDQPTTSAPAQ